VLEEGEFERLGSPKTLKVNVRVIASTNRDLEAEVKSKRFREDLYYRLNVFPVSIPPLRMRAEDIPLLVSHFVDKYARKFGRKYETVPKIMMKAFQEHPWPGNVRELEHVIERAVITSPGRCFGLQSRSNANMPKAERSRLKGLKRWSGTISSGSSRNPLEDQMAKAAPPPSSSFTRALFVPGSRSWA